MKYNKEKLTNKLKNKGMIRFIFLIIIIFTLINSVSAINFNDTTLDATNKSSKSLVHNVYSSSTNDDIQSIFDNSNIGDTIQFNDKSYNDISIVVNKRVNIISTKNSIIHTSNSISPKAKEMGIKNSFGFYFTNLASGSVIKGLTITGNADYGIMVEGGTDISILNNVVSGGEKAGINLHNANNNNIKDNTIKNAYDGVILENAQNNNILNNKIINNKVSGLRLEGYTAYNTIMYNNISGNVINIYANSHTNKDKITKNTLMYAKKSSNTYTTIDNTGAGICFGDNYYSVRKQRMIFEYNSIGFNQQWDAKSTMNHPAVDIGSNWYFDNNGNYGLGHICPMVFGGSLSADNFKHLTIGFSKSGKGIIGQLYEGSNAVGAGAFRIDNINIGGKDYGPVDVGSDGRFNIDLSKVPPGTKITVTINGHSFTVTLGKNENSQKNENKTSKTKSETTSESKTDETKDKSNTSVNNKTSTSSNSHGIDPNGESKGTGTGSGNYTTSGTNNGDIAGEKTGNQMGESSSDSQAYEITEKILDAAAKNNQFIAILGVVFLILLVVLGYKRKNNDDF